MRKANREECDPELVGDEHTSTFSHVSTYQPDHADHADRTRESGVFSHGEQTDQEALETVQVDRTPWTDSRADFHAWSQTVADEPVEPAPFHDAAYAAMQRDIATVAEDLADHGWRAGKISRTIGLTRIEILAILRRTGR